jgi:sortilin
MNFCNGKLVTSSVLFRANPSIFKYSAYATVVSVTDKEPVADFYRFDNLKDSGGLNYKVAFSGIRQFVAEGKFILLSSSQTHKRLPMIRGLNVSEDGGEHWNMVRLPEAALNDFYHLLDATEGMVLIHVAIGTSTGQSLDVGTIYSSDGSGIYFVPVLNNHVYWSGVTDFYKVESIRGTYITSVTISSTKNVSSHISNTQSVISYDRGGKWQLLHGPDEECRQLGEENCYLHLHHYISRYRHVNISHAIISHQNAPGLIMAHGNVGWQLKTTHIGVYISSDGGYTWKRVFDGAYHYAIANNGGLILAVPALGNGWAQAKLYYSFDWGDCWHWTTFISDRFQFTGLLIEPSVSSTDAAVWGYTTDDRIWHVNTLDFTSILRRPCTETDYETFVPHLAGSGGGCLLGYKETFFRRIHDHLCFGGKQYEPQATAEPCQCTSYDFECDYGYSYNREGKCVEDPTAMVTSSMYCRPGQFVYNKTLGYRPIPGDNCTKGVYYTYMSSETASCSGASGRKEVGGKASKPHNGDDNKYERKKKGGGVNVAAAVLVPLSLVVLAILGYWFYKKCYRRQNRFDYKYSMLAQEHEYSRKDLLTLDDDDDDDDDD